MINEDQLRDMKAILIYCNKNDLPNLVVDLAEKLELNKINKNGIYNRVCGKKSGLYEGLQWLSDNIS